MKTYIIGILVVLAMAVTLVYASRYPTAPRRRTREPIREVFPKEPAHNQSTNDGRGWLSAKPMPKRPAGSTLFMALAVDEKYCYVLDKRGVLRKIPKVNIKEYK